MLTDVLEPVYLGINDGIALHYSFEETNGTMVQDLSPNLRHATLIEGNLNSSGKFGSGVEFNNSGLSKIDLGPNELALTSNWTISTWFTYPLLDDFVDFRHALTSGVNNHHIAFNQTSSKELGVSSGIFTPLVLVQIVYLLDGTTW